jgi:uncharacterized protein (DUF488 family)
VTPASDRPVVIYSIGHSDHELDALIALLRQHNITTLVDVRSQPYSRWVPQANRETLARALEQAGQQYRFAGEALGGRPSDPSLYDATGRPDYDRIAVTSAFQAGLDQLIQLAQRENVAMMCSEGDYKTCHRALLITPQLLENGARVIHIHPDGTTIEARQEPKQLSLF